MPGRTRSSQNVDVNGDAGSQKAPEEAPHRLILCLDGTGNVFMGNNSDTNIVKILDMFNRSAENQWHYYQPGIGTYTADGSSVNQGFFGRIKKSVTQTIDAGLATSFDSHVIAAYRFLMRYYTKGALIYIFGFSRGAFTARFLARMVAHVGLLSMGNEELVPFAYKVYQDYEMGKPNAGEYMRLFRTTFCRYEPPPAETEQDVIAEEETPEAYADGTSWEDNSEYSPLVCKDHKPLEGSEKLAPSGIKVHFLGLFDTVNSVGTFDVPGFGSPKPAAVIGTARHIRHAVAIDERRVKFKAALLQQDVNEATNEDIKEVWFPGNHGDVGGGWPAEEPKVSRRISWWSKIKGMFGKTENTNVSNRAEDLFQLSDIALKWMIDELESVEGNKHLQWSAKKDDFLKRYKIHRTEAVRARMHDTMKFGGGSSFSKAILWKLMEYLPLIKRWEYSPKEKKWEYVRFPLNMGSTRDIPPGSHFHYSVFERMQTFPKVVPEGQKERGDPYPPPNDVTIAAGKDAIKLNQIQTFIENKKTLPRGKALTDAYFMKSEDLTLKGANRADYVLQVKGK